MGPSRRRRTPRGRPDGPDRRDQRRVGVLLRGNGGRLERRVPAARHDDHHRHPQADRPVRVSGHLGRQTGPRKAVRDHGDAVHDHGGRLRSASQRHDRDAGRAGHPAGLRPAPGATRGIPDRPGDGEQHRRHGNTHRRPAEPHHRQPWGPDVQRLPDPPHAVHRGCVRGLRAAFPLAVPRVFQLRPGTSRGDHAHRRAAGDPGSSPTPSQPGSARSGHPGVRSRHDHQCRAEPGGPAWRRPARGGVQDRCRRLPGRGGVADPDLLHGVVRDRGRPGQRRSDRCGRRGRHRSGW
jgi:hypothetical protein